MEASSGNVFADLGVPHPEECLAKAKLVQRIADAIAERRLTQAQAAGILGVDQPKVSALLRGKFQGFSIDRLLAPTAVWPGDHIFCIQDGFHYSLTLSKRPGQWVAKWPGGGRGGQVAGSITDPFRQTAVSVGKNTHFSRE